MGSEPGIRDGRRDPRRCDRLRSGSTKAARWSGDAIELPQSRIVDARLLPGGGLFGVGWGIGGLCPGPALTGLGAGFVPAAWFVGAMLVGMALHDRFLGPPARPL